jgi:glutamate---cysteine ligase / carboxylate-amine ligase
MSYDWFSVFGIELEYMIVSADSLDVRPIADAVLDELSGESQTMEVTRGPVMWSNELARHVLETKTNGPTPDLALARSQFATAVADMNTILSRHGARLLPSGMHPWMSPDHEFQLWPIDEEGIYGTFNRIFDCRGHGWSNLQSMHINLPFSGDTQLHNLHSAVRFLLPLLPALAASSPFIEGRRAANLDQRLSVYRTNARKVPLVSGAVVPEAIDSRADYEATILEPIYAALAPHDPEGALRYEWVNARGAITRFDRMAIEIRVLDTQECPRMDLAIACLVTEVLRVMCGSDQFTVANRQWSPERLANILWKCVADGNAALIDDADYLALFGVEGARLSAQDVWRHLLEKVSPKVREPEQTALLEDARWLVENGTLAQRLVQSLGATPNKQALRETYSRLADSLQGGDRFVPAP